MARPPAELGLDIAALDAFRDAVGGRGCVARHGYMAYVWGDVSLRGDVASACKPVFGHFLWKAIEEGRLEGPDDRVARFEPRLEFLNPALGFKDRGITFGQMASQTSCYGVSERPGTAFDYNDWQIALYADTLFLQVYGTTRERLDADVLHARLTDPLGCEDAPSFTAFGGPDRLGRFSISVRDFARFGLLYLHRGRWRGRQLLDPTLAGKALDSPLPSHFPRTQARPADMIPGQRTLGSRKLPDDQTDHLGSYSHAWWLNGIDREGRRNWPDAPIDTFAAMGHGGKRVLVVIPSLDLVASWNDSTIDGRAAQNRALARLVASARPTGRERD